MVEFTSYVNDKTVHDGMAAHGWHSFMDVSTFNVQRLANLIYSKSGLTTSP